MNPLRTYDYLVLSRSRLLGWVRPLSREQYDSDHPIGMGSLARTLHHIRAAEWSYMQRILGRTEPVKDVSPEHDPEITSGCPVSFEVLEPTWEREAKEHRGAIAAVRDWDSATIYTTIWEDRPYRYRASPADIFTQLVLHEVHHRAQALHILRHLGVSTEEIDYNALMWEHIESD